MYSRTVTCILLLFTILTSAPAWARTYAVGPGMEYSAIGEVPWESLAAGDQVFIYYRETPYNEKWVIGRRGTESAPIIIRGVPGPNGELPVIDGRNATTRRQLNYWGEARGVIKIGGSNSPPDTLPAYIVIENLDIRSGRTPYTFTGRDGLTAYASNAASLFIEKGEHITVRNCTMHDSGNGFFVSHETSDLLVDSSYIYDNGNVGDIYTHNAYTEANGITYQYNHFGPLRAGALGNNLKDRSAGTVIRYNWIEGGNRQLDLVESTALYTDPKYFKTFVYGNILIEPGDDGNRQIVHYGGDSGPRYAYRKGMLYFYNNSVISRRSSKTTLFRLSTNEEAADCRNNIVYVTAAGNTLAMLEESGRLTLAANWFKPGRITSHSSFDGTITDLGGHVLGDSPGFIDEAAQNYYLTPDSACRDAAANLVDEVLPDYDVLLEYVAH